MPRQFGDGQHRQEAQHPPDTHALLARKLFRAFARTVPKEEQLTNASAALPSLDMSALRGATVVHSTRIYLLRWWIAGYEAGAAPPSRRRRSTNAVSASCTAGSRAGGSKDARVSRQREFARSVAVFAPSSDQAP